ncbi:hypothetical protein [Siminovitchia fordii]|uniref:hypothetical protein n=1 Tax=Siminovitchia fordii TaxID=254759 RepID=UPI00039F6931|nr:hypothetical protein [Siminovitchia fordii]
MGTKWSIPFKNMMDVNKAHLTILISKVQIIRQALIEIQDAGVGELKLDHQ